MHDVSVELPLRFTIAPVPILGEVIEAYIEHPLTGNVLSAYNRKIWVEKVEPPTVVELNTGAYVVKDVPSYILVEYQYPVIHRFKHYLTEKGVMRALRTKVTDYQECGMVIRRVV